MLLVTATLLTLMGQASIFGTQGVAASPDGRTAYTLGGGGGLRIWDLEQRRQIGTRPSPPGGALGGIEVAANGTILAKNITSGLDSFVLLPGEEAYRAIPGYAVMDRAGEHLYSAKGRNLTIYALPSLEVVRTIYLDQSASMLHMYGDVTPNGRFLAMTTGTPSRGGSGLAVVDLEQGVTVASWRRVARERVACVAISPDGRRVAVCEGGIGRKAATVRLYMPAAGRRFARFETGVRVNDATFTDDGHLVVATNQLVRIWDPDAPRRPVRSYGSGNIYGSGQILSNYFWTHVRASPDGTRLIVGTGGRIGHNVGAIGMAHDDKLWIFESRN